MPCCRRTADASKRLVLKVLASRDQSPSAALEEGDGDGDHDCGDRDGDDNDHGSDGSANNNHDDDNDVAGDDSCSEDYGHHDEYGHNDDDDDDGADGADGDHGDEDDDGNVGRSHLWYGWWLLLYSCLVPLAGKTIIVTSRSEPFAAGGAYCVQSSRHHAGGDIETKPEQPEVAMLRSHEAQNPKPSIVLP